MIDMTLAPSTLWAAALAGPRRVPTLPAWLGLLFPGSLWILPIVGVAAFTAGMIVGRRLHRNLPSFACSNCGQSVCRRCLRRIRHEAYCASCGEALLRIQSASYSKLVLEARMRRRRRSGSILSRLTDWLIPGLGAIRRGRAAGAVFTIVLLVTGALAGWRGELPAARAVWLDGAGPGPWWPELPLALVGLALVTSAAAMSFGRRVHRTASRGYFAHGEGMSAPERRERAA
jgi:hypothetical protein